MKQLKEYLHLYLGCEIMNGIDDKIRVLKSSNLDTYIYTKVGNPKILLRPLSDMTEEEKEQIGFSAFEILRKNEFGDKVLPARNISAMWAAKQTAYLLSRHFDLFGLIESGLAIDKTLTPTP